MSILQYFFTSSLSGCVPETGNAEIEHFSIATSRIGDTYVKSHLKSPDISSVDLFSTISNDFELYCQEVKSYFDLSEVSIHLWLTFMKPEDVRGFEIPQKFLRKAADYEASIDLAISVPPF
jgi:hypothetical protein